MSSLRTMITIISTAVVTSAFWITVYSGAAGGGESVVPPVQQQAQPAGPAASNVASAETSASTSTAGIMTEEPGPDEETSLPVLGPGGLRLPVQGIAQRSLVDTYRASRSGGRVHNAIDIMAPRGTPVLAAAAGTVEKLHNSRLGGITAYVRSEDGRWVHYYAHLDAYAPGLAEGLRVEQGQLIGMVGFTGNASPAGPHLHFAVYRMAPGQRWYQGTPVNPYPLLAGSDRAR
jgi:murein DD-endopeptidase MepM/ murein hydrolase activator NlpD